MAVADYTVYEYPTGTYYFAANGRWKQLNAADYLALTEMGKVNGVVTVATAAHWTALVHSLGTPGPL